MKKLLLLVVAGISFISTQAAAQVINACVNNYTGDVRISSTCHPDETVLTWNSTTGLIGTNQYACTGSASIAPLGPVLFVSTGIINTAPGVSPVGSPITSFTLQPGIYWVLGAFGGGWGVSPIAPAIGGSFSLNWNLPSGGAIGGGLIQVTAPGTVSFQFLNGNTVSSGAEGGCSFYILQLQ